MIKYSLILRHTSSHTNTHTRTHERTNARTHTRMYARTRERTHTYKHTLINVLCFDVSSVSGREATKLIYVKKIFHNIS